MGLLDVDWPTRQWKQKRKRKIGRGINRQRGLRREQKSHRLIDIIHGLGSIPIEVSVNLQGTKYRAPELPIDFLLSLARW